MSAERGQSLSALEMERLLLNLVAIPSPSGGEAQAASHLTEWMSDNGYQAYVDDSGSAVGIRGDGHHEVVLLGHIDCFPGLPEVRIEGRTLFGRGTVDAKGPLACFAAAGALVSLPPGVRLVVIGATEEEADTSRGARHALDRYRPAACIIGEPSRWDRITLGYKGRLLVDWSWRGPLAHSAGPVLSPAEEALSVWNRILKISREQNSEGTGEFGRLEASLRMLNTDTEGAFGRAQMQIALRLPPDLQPLQLEERIRRLHLKGTLTFSGHEPAFEASKNSPLTRAFLRAMRAEGGQPRFVLKTGTSDMNVVGPTWGCPIVAYGPGDSRLDHTPHEHIDLDEYQTAIRVLHAALDDLLDGGM